MRHKTAGLSAIFGIIIGLGLTAAAGAAVYSQFQAQVDPFVSSSAIEVRNLNAIRDGSELTITATLKNVGQTSISGVFIDTIKVSDVTISQDAGGAVMLTGANGSRTYCESGCSDMIHESSHYRGFSVKDGAGLTESVLEGGRTHAFKIVVDSAAAPNIQEDVNISDRLSLTLRVTSGDDELVSDVYSTRVKPG